MTAATRAAAVAGALTRTLGELVTYRYADGAGTRSLAAVIVRRSEPVWTGGMVGVAEDHYTGYVLAASVGPSPALGDSLIAADGTRYEIDQAPQRERGLWSLVLRKYTS